MVKILPVLLLGFAPIASLAIDADEIMQLQQQAYSRAEEKNSRLNANNLKDTDKLPSEQKAPKKGSKQDPANTKILSSNKYEKKTIVAPNNPRSYNYPTDLRNNNTSKIEPLISGNVSFDSVKIKQRSFGIPPGSILHGEIRRDIVSSEPAKAEIHLTKPFIGSKRTLPAGTLIFARMAVNPATKRIEMFVESGVTPEAYEFALQGIVRDEYNVSGISGIIEENNGEILKKGLASGTYGLVRGAINSVSPGTIIGDAAREGTNDVIQEQRKLSDTKINTNIIIYASPQPVKIFIEKAL